MTVFKQLLPKLQNINNPVLPGREGTLEGLETDTSGPLAYLIARLWLTVTFLGAILVLAYLLWGSVEWITSGGDTEKLKHARYKMTNAIIGLFILVMIYAIVLFLKWVFGFSLVNIAWPAFKETD